jgi:hypothetical protein
MRYRVEIKIEDIDTKAVTTISLPAMTEECLSRLSLPIGKLFQEGTLFCRTTMNTRPLAAADGLVLP